jgi:hypothetical protein
MARQTSRIALILLALCHLTAAATPCGREARSEPAAASHEHALADPSAPPCHGPGAGARAWLEARCPCGCGDAGSAPARQPTLGAAVLPGSIAWISPPSRPEPSPAPRRLPTPPLERIEHVPLAA